ncbi:MAG: CoA transferase [Actinomycetota bacterium]|nr:CoA transferase [Acidimicrobiales bacterium]MEC8976975.1 CoA transferase [Actinomycetota bacterium]MED5173730.1 CoA transferase [Actinomycetota bacterium]
MTANNRALPLDGITVLDLGQIYQGPYAGFLLSMAGARVIKIEQTRGEPLRARGDSLPYAALNSSKEAVTLDLKSSEGREMFLGLAASADVVLVNYAPGVPEKLGIDAESLWKVNPQLVFAHASGFGLSGPDSAQTAMDITVQAHMGPMSVTGHPDQPPVKAGVAFVDFLGGAHLYGAIVSALFDAQRTGKGRLVETSMAEATYHTLCSNMLSWHQTGASPRTGNKHAAMGVAPYDVYQCSDGHVALISVTNRHWRSVLEVIGREDLLTDPRFRHNTDRAAHMGAVDELVEEWTRQRSREEVASLLGAAGVPIAVVRNVEEVVKDQHLIERQFLQWVSHPTLGEIPLPHSPLRFHGSTLRELDLFHAIGEDNESVYGEFLDLTAAEIEALRERGVV